MKVAIVCAFTAVGAVLAQTNGCMSGYGPGTDTVLFTTPYTYQQVMSIIGSFKNLTWSGNPDNTVTLDGVDTYPQFFHSSLTILKSLSSQIIRSAPVASTMSPALTLLKK